MQRVTGLSAAVVAGIVLGSCVIVDRLGETEPRSFTLTPLLQGVQQAAQARRDGVCPTLARSGTASEARRAWEATGGVDENGMLIGYSATLRRGADPFPCNEWVFHAFQGRALFDLSGLPDGTIVQQATVSFTRRFRTIADEGSESEPCGYRLGTGEGLSTSPLTVAAGPEGQIAYRATRPDTAVAPSTLDITRTVDDWVRRDTSEPWLVFSPADGTTFTEHSEDDATAYCIAHVNDVVLTITALVPPES